MNLQHKNARSTLTGLMMSLSEIWRCDRDSPSLKTHSRKLRAVKRSQRARHFTYERRLHYKYYFCCAGVAFLFYKTRKMSVNPKFVSPFHRPHCLSAAAPAGQAKLTHPGKAILAGKCLSVLVNHKKQWKSFLLMLWLTPDQLCHSFCTVIHTVYSPLLDWSLQGCSHHHCTGKYSHYRVCVCACQCVTVSLELMQSNK